MGEVFNLMAANAVAVRAPISGQTGVWVYNSKTLVSSAMKMSGVVVSGKSNSMTVLPRGKSYDALVRNSATLRVSNGGYVESTTVGGTAFLSNAGTAVSTFLSGGTMTLSNGGVANGVSLMKNAKLTVASGGVATEVAVVSNGNVNATVYGNDSVTQIDGNNELGSFFLSGGTASNFVLNSTGQLVVSSGGVALSTVIRTKGLLYVGSGGTALETEWRPGVGNLYVLPGGIAPVLLSGVYFCSSVEPSINNTSSAMYLSGFSAPKSSNYVWIFSGGTAVDCNVTSVCSGGYAINCSGSNTVIYSGGSVDSFFFQGNSDCLVGTATSASIDGRLHILGGMLTSATVSATNALYVSSGGTAIAVVEDGGAVFIQDDGFAEFAPNIMSGRTINVGYHPITVHSKTVITSCIIATNGLDIYSGGRVENVSGLNNSVSMLVYVEGTLSGFSRTTSMFKGTEIFVSSGGIVDGAIISATGDKTSSTVFTVSSGGIALNIFNDVGGTLVAGGGYISGAIIDNGRTISVCSGGTALGVSLLNGATAVVDDGGYIKYV